jgi:hypothetical protein
MKYMIAEVLLRVRGLQPQTYYILNNCYLGYLTFGHFDRLTAILLENKRVSYRFKEVAVCDATGLNAQILHSIFCEDPKRRMSEEDFKTMLGVCDFRRVEDRPWVRAVCKPRSSEQYFVHVVPGDDRQMFSRGFE